MYNLAAVVWVHPESRASPARSERTIINSTYER